MEEMQQNTQPSMNNMPETAPERTHKLLIPIICIGVVLLALILGGFYIWGSLIPEVTVQQLSPRKNTPNTPPAISENTSTASDELGTIEKDQKEIDKDFSSIDAEFRGIDIALTPAT